MSYWSTFLTLFSLWPDGCALCLFTGKCIEKQNVKKSRAAQVATFAFWELVQFTRFLKAEAHTETKFTNGNLYRWWLVTEWLASLEATCACSYDVVLCDVSSFVIRVLFRGMEIVVWICSNCQLVWKRQNCKIREVPQIVNVDISLNVDVESYPVGCSPPQIPVFLSCSELNSAIVFCIFWKRLKANTRKKSNTTKKENDMFVAWTWTFCGLKDATWWDSMSAFTPLSTFPICGTSLLEAWKLVLNKVDRNYRTTKKWKLHMYVEFNWVAISLAWLCEYDFLAFWMS